MTTNSLNMLLVEITACLAVAALLGVFVGWMMRRSIAKRAARMAAEDATKRYKDLEEANRLDTINLEEQMQSMGLELKALKTNNQNLNESLRTTEMSIHKARTESIELNQAQLDTNERLQSIIRHKEMEISQLTRNSNAGKAGLAAVTGAIVTSSADDTSGPFDPMDATEVLDSTAVMNNSLFSIDDDHLSDTIAALDESSQLLREERQALIAALTETEETEVINHQDLPLELQKNIVSTKPRVTAVFEPDATDIDATIVLDEQADETSGANASRVDDDAELTVIIDSPQSEH